MAAPVAAILAAYFVLVAVSSFVGNDERVQQIHRIADKALRTLDYEAGRVAAVIPGATAIRTYERRDNFDFVRAEYSIRFEPRPGSEVR